MSYRGNKDKPIMCADCREHPAVGKFYYTIPFKYWVYQCNGCAQGFQAFKPFED